MKKLLLAAIFPVLLTPMAMAQQAESLPKPKPVPSSATLERLTRELVSFGLRPH